MTQDKQFQITPTELLIGTGEDFCPSCGNDLVTPEAFKNFVNETNKIVESLKIIIKNNLALHRAQMHAIKEFIFELSNALSDIDDGNSVQYVSSYYDALRLEFDTKWETLINNFLITKE